MSAKSDKMVDVGKVELLQAPECPSGKMDLLLMPTQMASSRRPASS